MSAHNRGLWRGYRWRESGWTRTRAALSLGMVMGLGAVGTMAAWSETVAAQTGLFSTGSVSLKINEAASEHVFTAVNNVERGQSLSGMINLRNDGGIALKYLMDIKVAGSGTAIVTPGFQRGSAAALGDNLKLDVYAGGTSNSATCSSTTNIVTQAAMTVGELARPLLISYRNVTVGSTDSICVKVTLAAAAPIESRMAQVGVTFTANAEIL